MTPRNQRLHELNLKSDFQKLLEVLPPQKVLNDENQLAFERIKEVIEKAQRAIASMDANDTPLNAVLVLRESLSQMESVLRGRKDNKNFDFEILDSATDKILEQIPFIKVESAFYDKLNIYQKEIELKYNEIQLQHQEIVKMWGDYSQQANTVVENIKRFEIDGQEIVHFLSGRALQSFYADRANGEKMRADRWTLATWVFASLAIVTLIATLLIQIYWVTGNNEIYLQYLGSKALLTATLGLIAKWSSRRANRHLAEEAKYHRLAVNLQTLNTFILGLNEENKNNVLAAIALRTFTDGTGNEVATDFETASGLDFIKDLFVKK